MASVMESAFVADTRTSILTFIQDEDEADNNMELPAALTASDKESFAYPSLKDRLPIIICKVMISFSQIYIQVLYFGLPHFCYLLHSLFVLFQVIDLLHRQRLQLNLKDPDSLKSALEGMVSLIDDVNI